MANEEPSKLDRLIMEHKTSNEIPLTPEQVQEQMNVYKAGWNLKDTDSPETPLTAEEMQALQDAYDQLQAPTTDVVDFASDRDAYLTGRQIREEIRGEDPTLF